MIVKVLTQNAMVNATKTDFVPLEFTLCWQHMVEHCVEPTHIHNGAQEQNVNVYASSALLVVVGLNHRIHQCAHFLTFQFGLEQGLLDAGWEQGMDCLTHGGSWRNISLPSDSFVKAAGAPIQPSNRICVSCGSIPSIQSCDRSCNPIGRVEVEAFFVGILGDRNIHVENANLKKQKMLK